MKKEPKKVEPSVIAKSKREDGKVDLYGVLWPGGTPMVSVELACYRDAGTERAVEGNLGAEEHFLRAWKLMWPDFLLNDWSRLLIHCWCNYKWIIVLGHQRASKSYTTAFCLFLDYCADPANTLTSMGTTTFDGLRIRMWSDVQRAAETAAIKFPLTIRSTTNELRIYPTEFQGESAQKFQVMGMALNNSKDAPGRIRGGHAPRRRLVIDEAEAVADPIYEAMINPMSAPDAKCAMLCNPMERISKFGQWCEPEDGWGSVTPTSLMWRGKAKNSIVLHFDGLQSPNVKEKTTKYPGLLTQENVDEVMSKYGENSLQWWSLIRGWFPPDGLVSRIFSSGTIEKARKPIVFDFTPKKCASFDAAFEADDPVVHLGEIGHVHRGDTQMAINCTETIVLKFQTGPDCEPKDYQAAHQLINICKSRGIPPEHFIMDTTGSGRGTFAIMQKEWSQDIQGLNYGGKATERSLRGDDSRKCDEIYKYFVTEIWMRAAEFCKERLIGGLDNLDENTLTDLGARRYILVPGTEGKLMQAESKVDLKSRLGRSPDFGDSFVQFGELLERLGTRPGLPSFVPMASNKWSKHREKAVQLASVYRDELQFTTGDSW